MITIEKLHKKFGSLEVLKGIDLQIKSGGVFAILGPNGSGKTTLIKSMLGMVIPNSGDIWIQVENIKKQWRYRHQVSYLPQIAHFPKNLKVAELLKMIKNLKNKPCDETSLVATFNLAPFLNKNLGDLSGGTKQKVNAVLTFMVDNPIIIMDEPTSGLDPASVLELKKIILAERAKGKTIIISSHILSFIEEISDEIVFLLDGNIYFKGSVSKLKENTNKSNFEEAIASILTTSYA
ncbi:ABC transporter ATP-binding protein [Zhouia amylolytica]|uniref:ABC transporter ATP-binding protein n=1 Tax=Zhouia amylolytica TaxID=376730 RepID=UPI0020CE6B6A|nr:ABC transporter ATP-binding protein [Zhouia amylolytica]MCQ0110329.1 ABC transporter ATP-binding protein [Zhouia amylolytica]